MGRILAPCFREGICPTDEYLPHDLEMIFIRPRTNTCFLLWRGYSSEAETNSLVYALRILWGRINDFMYTNTAALGHRDGLLVR